MQITNNANAKGWNVTVPDNYYKVKIDAINNTLSGELFVARNDLFIVGGAVESGWDSGRSIRMTKDLHNPNLFVFSGMLKEATSGNDRNMFKLLGQSNWDPVHFHPKVNKEGVLESKYIFENLAGDYKWALDLTKQGSYVIKVDLLEETITAERTNLVALYVNGQEWKNLDELYTLDCSNSSPTSLNIEIVPLLGATVDIGTSIEFDPAKSGLNTLNFTITSPNGEDRMSYKLNVTKPFGFYDLVTQMWNNTLTVNNNPLKNGGYKFVDFQWYENDKVIGSNRQYYSAGKSATDLLNANAVYMVKLKDDKGNGYETCPTHLTLETLNRFLPYPNPARAGETVSFDTPVSTSQQLVNNVSLKVSDLNGNVVHSQKVNGDKASFEINAPGMYLIQLISNDNVRTAKLLVK